MDASNTLPPALNSVWRQYASVDIFDAADVPNITVCYANL